MSARGRKRVREQVVAYLDARDRGLLEKLVQKTGLAKTELFRRGLRRLAEDLLSEHKPGSSLAYLVATAADGLPPDLAERHDHYLYGGGYAKLVKKKRARPR